MEKNVKIPYKQLHPWNQDSNPFNDSDQSHIRTTFKRSAIGFHEKYISILPAHGQSSIVFLTYLGYMLTVKMIDYQADENHVTLYPRDK